MKNFVITLVMLLFIGTVSAQTTPKTTKKAKTSSDTIMNHHSTTTKSSTYKTDTIKTKHPAKTKSSTKTSTTKTKTTRDSI